jgi:hypothetical protein
VDWQQIVSLAIVATAAAMLAAGKLRRPKFSFARVTHCGCSAVHQTSPGNSIIFRARKGERPQVVVKMRS